VVRRAWPIITVVNSWSITEHLLIILILLALLLVLVDHGLGRFLAGALRRVGARLVALGQVVDRAASWLVGAVAVLVVLVVVGVAVEVGLLLEVARRVRARLHAGDVAGLGSGVVPLAEVLRAALLVWAVLCCRVRRAEGLGVVRARLLPGGVPTVRQSGPVVRKGSCCTVSWVDRLSLALRRHLLQSAVAASPGVMFGVTIGGLTDVMRLHLRDGVLLLWPLPVDAAETAGPAELGTLARLCAAGVCCWPDPELAALLPVLVRASLQAELVLI